MSSRPSASMSWLLNPGEDKRVSWPGGTTSCTVWCCWMLYWACSYWLCSSSICPQSSATSSSTLLDETTVCLCAIVYALCIPQEVLYILLMLQLSVLPIFFSGVVKIKTAKHVDLIEDLFYSEYDHFTNIPALCWPFRESNMMDDVRGRHIHFCLISLIEWLMFWSIKCQKTMKNVHHRFPHPHLKIACYARPTVQNPKIINLTKN